MATKRPFRRCAMLMKTTSSLHEFENGGDFERITGVCRSKLKQIRDGGLISPEVRTVVAICVGLNMDTVQTMELLRSAGHILLNTREHWAYKYIIACCDKMTLEQRNAILIALGIPPPGSRTASKRDANSSKK